MHQRAEEARRRQAELCHQVTATARSIDRLTDSLEEEGLERINNEKALIALRDNVLIRNHNAGSNIVTNYGPIKVFGRDFVLITEFDSSELVQLNNERRKKQFRIFASYTAIALVLGARAALNETFLVADAEPISVADLVAAMREGLGRAPHLVKMPLGAIKRMMASFGRDADWERISGAFVIDASKLMRIGWRPSIATREGIIAMMRSGNGADV